MKLFNYRAKQDQPTDQHEESSPTEQAEDNASHQSTKPVLPKASADILEDNQADHSQTDDEQTADTEETTTDEDIAQREIEQNPEVILAESTFAEALHIASLSSQIPNLGTEISKNISTIEKLGDLARAAVVEKLKYETQLKQALAQLRVVEENYNRALREAEATAIDVRASKLAEEQAKENLVEAREMIFKLRSDGEVSADNLQRMRSENQILKNQNTELVSERDELQAECDKLLQQKNGLNLELESTIKQVLNLEKELKQNSTDFQNINQRNQIITGELAELNTRFISVKEELSQTKTTLIKANDDVFQLRQEAELSTRRHENDVFLLKSEIDNLTSQLALSENFRKEINQETNRLKEKDQRESERLSELELELDRVKNQKDGYAGDIHKSNAQIREIKLKYESTMIDLKHEQDQNKQLTDRLDNALSAVKKAENIQISYTNAIEQVKQLKALINRYRIPATALTIADNDHE